MAKKILASIGTLVLGVGLGFLVWLLLMDGKDIIAKPDFPTEPEGKYTDFYYSQLDDTEKIAYEVIMSQIEEMPKKIKIPDMNGEINDVFEAILYDNPKYFFLSKNCKVETNRFGSCFFVPEYSMSDVEYQAQLSELEKVKNTVLENTATIIDDYGFEMYIHDYIINKCEYVDKTDGAYSSAYGCLVKGYASCEGYSKAMKYLLDEVEIENYIALGTTEDENNEAEGHAWNIVKIENEYYHLDVTWNDPVTVSGDKNAVNHYVYFNLNDKEISKTHTPEERFLGKCTKTDFNFYVKEDLLFSEYDGDARSKVTSEIVKQAKLGNNVASFKFKNSKAFKDAQESLFKTNGIYSVLLAASTATDNKLADDEIKYALDESRLIITISDFLA